MNLVTGDTNLLMTAHVFEEIFKRILFPMFSQTGLHEFITTAQDAFESWQVKFELEHKMV
jgi:hypothetical protein